MAFNRAAILYDNLIPGAALAATSAASVTMGVDKLKTPSPRERYRSTGVVSETIRATTGQPEYWPNLEIIGHNFAGSGQVRVRISDNADLSAPRYDAVFDAYPSIVGLEEGGLDEGGLDGLPIVEDLEDWQRRSFFLLNLVLSGTATAASPTTLTIPTGLTRPDGGSEPAADTDDAYLAATLTIRSGTGAGQSRTVAGYSRQARRLTVDSAWSVTPDTTSAFDLDLSFPVSKAADDGTYYGAYLGLTLLDPENPDGYLQAGVLCAGSVLQPTYDIDADLESGWVDPSERVASYGDELFIDTRGMYQTATITFSYLSEAEANELVHAMGARVGARRPVTVLPFAENSSRLYTDAIYGYLDAPPRKRLVRPDYSGYSWQVTLSIRGL